MVVIIIIKLLKIKVSIKHLFFTFFMHLKVHLNGKHFHNRTITFLLIRLKTSNTNEVM